MKRNGVYLQFRQQWLGVGCFSIYQVRAWRGDFDRSNLTRWVKKGYLCRLRQDWYTFGVLLAEPDMTTILCENSLGRCQKREKICTPCHTIQNSLRLIGQKQYNSHNNVIIL